MKTRTKMAEYQKTDPTCEDEAGTTLTIKPFSVLDPDEEKAQDKAVIHVTDEIEKDLKAKNIKCDKPCPNEGYCFVDIEPSIKDKLTTPKAVLMYNKATKTYDKAWACGINNQVTFTMACNCAILV